MVNKIKIIFFLLSVSVCSVGFLYFGGFRLNMTASLPKGIYKITEREAAKYARGDLIMFCLPENEETKKAKERGYILPGFACGGSLPLMKRVAGISGDRIEVKGGNLHVNGRPLKNGNVFKKDGERRDMKSCGDLTLSENEVFAVSLYNPKSFDSRYFGPVNKNSIIGKVRRFL